MNKTVGRPTSGLWSIIWFLHLLLPPTPKNTTSSDPPNSTRVTAAIHTHAHAHAPWETPRGVPAVRSWALQRRWAGHRGARPQQTTPAGSSSSAGSEPGPGSPDKHAPRTSWCRWQPGPPAWECWVRCGSPSCPSPAPEARGKKGFG